MKVFIGVFSSVAIIMVVLLVVFGIIIPSIKRKYVFFAREHSKAIKALYNLNHQYQFFDIRNFDMQHSYDNEVFYNNISCKDYLIYQLQFKKKDFLEQINNARVNAVRFLQYKQGVFEQCRLGEYDAPLNRLNRKKLFKIEKQQIKTLVMSPTTSFAVKIALFRTDLNGRRYEYKVETFDENIIKSIINDLNDRDGGFYLNRDIWDAICRVERGKVSNKMRFSIMKRDGYRCRYCGRRDNGHNLEIDHIVPIAKGGKSTYDNLQTLCHDCNVKKGDSIVDR